MRISRTSGWAIARIEGYRSRRPVGAPSRCNFEPSCSHFAQEAIRTRLLPIALVMTAWRIARCNLLSPGRTPDPVDRHRRALRPNSVPTALGAMAVTGLLVLLGAEAVGAQNVAGGCSATANGRDPATMTADKPLVVKEGQEVSVSGTVPAAIASLPAGQIDSNTIITISLIEGLVEPSTESHAGTGPQWGDSVEVDDYLKWGVGLYRVEGSASGTGWACSGDGYVKLEDGNPLGKPVGQAAAAMFALGTVGSVASARRSAPAASPGPTARDIKDDFKNDAERLLGIEDPPKPDRTARTAADGGCAAAIGLFGFLFGAPYGMMAALPGALDPPAAANDGSRRIWRRGHPILGFLSGVIAGLGLTVLAQQFALWPLTLATAIVFPLLVGVLSGLRAWRGRPFRVAG